MVHAQSGKRGSSCWYCQRKVGSNNKKLHFACVCLLYFNSPHKSLEASHLFLKAPVTVTWLTAWLTRLLDLHITNRFGTNL